MKSLQILKGLVDLFLFFSIFSALGIVLVVPMKMINPDFEIPFVVKGIEVSGNDWLSISVIICSAIAACFFIYAIFILRKVLQSFSRNEIFSDKVISYFKVIGNCIIASALLTSIPMFFYNMINRNSLGIEFTGGGFDSLLLSVSLGLLFIVIGAIFQKAKDIKEENELTV